MAEENTTILMLRACEKGTKKIMRQKGFFVVGYEVKSPSYSQSLQLEKGKRRPLHLKALFAKGTEDEEKIRIICNKVEEQKGKDVYVVAYIVQTPYSSSTVRMIWKKNQKKILEREGLNLENQKDDSIQLLMLKSSPVNNVLPIKMLS